MRSYASRRTRILLPLLLLAAALATAGCSASLPQGTSGSIALIPFWDEEQGIQGVQPLQDWSEEALLRQSAAPLSREEVNSLLLDQTDLSTVPASTGRFRGKAFTWDLYAFESYAEGVPVDTVHFDLAVAETESTTYVVMLIALPEAYQANPALYDTIFTHALYALEPME